MQITFVDVPVSQEQIYGTWDLSPLDTYCPPLGLLSLAAYVREHGHEAEIIDMQGLRWSVADGVDYLHKNRPDAIGITAKTASIMSVTKFLEDLRKKGIDVPIVLGGAHATAASIETMEKLK